MVRATDPVVKGGLGVVRPTNPMVKDWSRWYGIQTQWSRVGLGVVRPTAPMVEVKMIP